DLTTSVTHLWRLLKWGRTLARHGALRGIEEDPLTPRPVRRLARIARFGAQIPPVPDYAKALQEIGPAAIKLGQALSTRPDPVGERAPEKLAQVGRKRGQLQRLRPRRVVAHFKQWTTRELDLQREAASASELRENMIAEPGYFIPEIDWRRTARRVLTLEWLDGVKLNDRDALIAVGQDCKALAAILVRAFLRQAVVDGFFHAD